MAIVNELVTKFSYQGSVKPVQDYSTSLFGAFKILAAGAGLVAAAGAGLAHMTLKTLESAEKIDDLSIRTGVSVEAIQRLGYVATMSGSSFDSMSSSLDGLNIQMGLALNGEAMQADTFKELGISLKDANGQVKTADVVFTDLQKSLQNSHASVSKVAGVLRKLRLDPTLSKSLLLSADSMTKLEKSAENAGIMTSKQVEEAGKASDMMTEMKFRIKGLSDRISISLTPAITDGTNGFMDFLDANKDLISEGLNIVKGVISGVIQVMGSLWTAVDALISNTIGWKAALVILTGVIIRMNIAMLANPAVWIAAAFIGLLLIIDDLVVAFEGGESAIADFFKSMFGIDIVNSMIKGFNILRMVIASLVTPILQVGRAFIEMQLAGAKGLNTLGASIDTKGISKDLESFKAIQNEVSLTANGQANMIALKPAFSGTTQNTQSNQTNITVNGATDPKATAKAVGATVQTEMKSANAHFDRKSR